MIFLAKFALGMPIGWAVARLQRWWKRRHCRHNWRPARTSIGPAKHCDRCYSTVQMTEEEFYAWFERIPYYI